MCLRIVTKRHDPPLKERSAWKVFLRGGHGRLIFECVGGSVRRGVWMRAKTDTIGFGANGYRNGFHAFSDRAAAERWCGLDGPDVIVVRVRLRGIRTEGDQSYHDGPIGGVLVADQLFVPELKPRKAAKR